MAIRLGSSSSPVPGDGGGIEEVELLLAGNTGGGMEVACAAFVFTDMNTSALLMARPLLMRRPLPLNRVKPIFLRSTFFTR